MNQNSKASGPDQPAHRGKPSRWVNVLLALVSTIVGIGIFEVGIRTFKFNYDLSPNWRFHPVLGWSQIPNGHYNIIVQGRPVEVSFNSLGFRDTEHQKTKPPGVKRIVFIGDSFLEAVQVNLDETLQRQLQALLNRRDSTKWEVINLGVGDFGTAQEYIALERYGLDFNPDLVIHEIFPLNDICNNGFGLYGLCRSQNDGYRPYFFEFQGDLREVYAQSVRMWLRRHLVSYNVIEYWLLKLSGFDPQSNDDKSRPANLRARGFTGLDPLLYTYVHADSEPELVSQGWSITEKLIERIVEITRARGIGYVALVAPFEMALAGWDTLASAQPPPRMDRTYPEARLGALFARLKVPSVMLLDEFQPYLKEVLPFIGGHLSAAGHQRAAEALYRKIDSMGTTSHPTSSSGR